MSESTCFRTYKALANATAHTYIDFGLNRQIWVDENYSTKAVEVIYKFYWLKLVMCHAISRMLHFRSDHTVVSLFCKAWPPSWRSHKIILLTNDCLWQKRSLSNVCNIRWSILELFKVLFSLITIFSKMNDISIDVRGGVDCLRQKMSLDEIKLDVVLSISLQEIMCWLKRKYF